MKKLLFLALIFISLVSFAQTNPDGKNWKHTGTNTFTKAIVVQAQTLSGTKIESYDDLVNESTDTIALESVAVMKVDSTGERSGWTTRHDFLTELISSESAKQMKVMGSPYKVFPPIPLMLNSHTSFIDNRIGFQIVYIPDTIILTGISYYLAVNGTSVYDQTNGFALYKVNGANIELVRQATDATMFSKGEYTKYNEAWDSGGAYTALPGWYYIAMLVNYSTANTQATVSCQVVSEFLSTGYATYQMCPYIAAQNSFAASYAISSMTSTTGYVFAVLPY